MKPVNTKSHSTGCKNYIPGMVSVVIAAYNASKFIRQTLDSVLNQSYENVEIMVVDDGSTDDTWEILQEYARQKKIMAIRHDTNYGTWMARNTGINNTHGEWIKPFDADDIMYRDCIKTLVSATAVARANRYMTIISAHHDYVAENGKLLPSFKESYKHMPLFDNITDHFELCLYLILYSSPTNIVGFMWHRPEFMKYGMFANWYGEDVEVLLRLCVLCGWNLHIIPENVGAYRLRPGSKTDVVANNKNILMEYERMINTILFKITDDDLRNSYIEILEHVKKQKPYRLRKIVYKTLKKLMPNSVSEFVLFTYRKYKYGVQYANDCKLRESFYKNSWSSK